MEEKILTLIQQFDNIIIHRHERPDEDAYGSQCGLALILKASFPNKKIYVVGKEDPALNYLANMDCIHDKEWTDALVIVTDTANLARIDDQRYTNAQKLIKIDHHPNKEPYGDLCWVDPSFSSTSEMIFHWFYTLRNKGLICPDEAARLLYAGIVGDTGRFLFAVSGRTFAYAHLLMNYAFNYTELYRNMYEQKLSLIKLQGYIFENVDIHKNKVATVFIGKKVQADYNVLPAECSRLVYSISNIKGIDVWALFIEGEDVIRVNIRSKGPKINEIAEKYNGGGHPLAAGARVENWEMANKLITDLVNITI